MRKQQQKKPLKPLPKRTTNVLARPLPDTVCKAQVLLRDIPCEIVQAINRKKIEIMNNNPHRTTVSNSEAIYKLILKG